MVYAIALATFASTMLGGLVALRLKDKLHLILGFSAGAVIGVAFFDLLPEALALGTSAYAIPSVLSTTALGFLAYLMLDRTVLAHRHEEDLEASLGSHRGRAGAGTLSVHSFLDGLGIGFGFQVAPAIGGVVALAVLAHDFSDGINAVNFILRSGGGRRIALRWLLLDALAPALGIFSTLLFSLPQAALGLLLALFAGFFLYIGASDLIPESHHAHPTYWTTFSTILGAAVLYAIVHFIG